jgi:hypothetical protein
METGYRTQAGVNNKDVATALVSQYTGPSVAMLISAKAAGKMKAHPLNLSSSAVLGLYLNLGRTYTFHCRRKSKRASK